ncbi:ZIP family metal transporter [archaeon CG10_big_fil_rev_8_21_14_0_10_43_11]|nr:MAG: ZIP family metal transporter [archaeon CG10_big_fil_rev_8_21_14_0_10_43_11]
MAHFLATMIATLGVSLISFIGVFTLSIEKKKLTGLIRNLVSLSAGTLIGGALLHLLPEAMATHVSLAMVSMIFGFVIFGAIEFIIKQFWHAQKKQKTKSFAYMNLIGDGVHNFLDGLIIGTSFSANMALGITSTLAVALHEIPQEIGDFAILLYAGMKTRRALMHNFLSALFAILGGIIGVVLLESIHSISAFLLAFAAGGFFYIACIDLIPELARDKKKHPRHHLLIGFLTGFVLMLFLTFF